MDLKMLNDYILIGNLESGKGGLTVPIAMNNNMGKVVHTSEANKELIGSTVYFDTDCKQIKLDGKHFFVMKPSNLILQIK